MVQVRPLTRGVLGLGGVAALALAGTVAFAAAPAAAATATRYVTTSGSDPGNDCTDSADPCVTIQHAVDEAASGDSVSVGAGTYTESVSITKSITVTGAGRDKTTVIAPDDEGDFIPALLIGDPGTGTVTVALAGLTATGSIAGGEAVNATVTLTDAAFDDNGGFGFAQAGGSLTATRTSFSGNGSSADGTLTELGFGVEVSGGQATFTDSTIDGNGIAGVYVLGNAPSAVAAPAAPGVTVEHSTVSGNLYAGIANGPGGQVTVDQSTVSGNHGAGIYAAESSTTVTNSTIADTTEPGVDPDDQEILPDPAGVLYLGDLSEPTSRRASALSKSIFSAPTSLRVAGRKLPAANNTPDALAPDEMGVSLSGTILSQDADIPDCAGSDDIVDDGYNLSGDADNSCGFDAAEHDLTDTDPELGALADNGGPTETQLPLGKTSPVIDAIPSGAAGCSSGADDQRGIERPQGTNCDIGAVEVAQPPLVIKPGALPDGTVGEAYKATLTASGGLGEPYAFTLAPGSSLPAGLELSDSGVISGTPRKAGSVDFTVSVDDPVLKDYTIVIEAPAPAGTDQPGTGQPAPADNDTGPLADTGADVLSLSTAGGAALLLGMLVLVAAGLVRRRPGRHRVN